MSNNVDLPKLQRSLDWALENQLPKAELVAMLRPLVQHTSLATSRGQLSRVQLAENLLLVSHPTPLAAQAAHWEAASLLHRLLRALEESSDGGPERVSLLARALGAFGLACTFLEHYRLAKRAYVGALKAHPSDAVVAHNLGHLLAVKLGAPLAGLYWLQRAHSCLPDNVEIAASLAHALVRTRQGERAAAILARVLNDSGRANDLVTQWMRESAGD